MQNLALDYVNSLKENEDFKRLLELKKIIDTKYSLLIVKFKNKEAKYLEAKEHPQYYKDISVIQSEFVEAKKELYSKEEVVQYFKLERKLDEIFNDDFNDIKTSISNKFINNNLIKM